MPIKASAVLLGGVLAREAEFHDGGIGQAADLVNRFVTWAAGDDDFHRLIILQLPPSISRPPNAIAARVPSDPSFPLEAQPIGPRRELRACSTG